MTEKSDKKPRPASQFEQEVKVIHEDLSAFCNEIGLMLSVNGLQDRINCKLLSSSITYNDSNIRISVRTGTALSARFLIDICFYGYMPHRMYGTSVASLANLYMRKGFSSYAANKCDPCPGNDQMWEGFYQESTDDLKARIAILLEDAINEKHGINISFNGQQMYERAKEQYEAFKAREHDRLDRLVTRLEGKPEKPPEFEQDNNVLYPRAFGHK